MCPCSTSATIKPRQREIGLLLVQGLTASDIARILILSPSTVCSHIARLAACLGMGKTKNCRLVALRLIELGCVDRENFTKTAIVKRA